MSILEALRQAQGSPVKTKEPVNYTPLTRQDRGLILRLSTDIKQFYKLKGKGAIGLLYNIYGKCYFVNDGCYAKVSTLAKDTGQSRSQVYRQLARLKRAGVIELRDKELLSSQLTGKTKLELTEDFKLVLGMLKRAEVKLRIRHTGEQGLANNSIIKVLRHLTKNKLVYNRYFKAYVKGTFRDYATTQDGTFRDYATSEALKILVKLEQIRNLNVKGLRLTKYMYSYKTNYNANSSQVIKETEEQNKKRIALNKAKALSMLDNLADTKQANKTALNNIDIALELEKVYEQYNSDTDRLLKQLTEPLELVCSKLAEQRGENNYVRATE